MAAYECPACGQNSGISDVFEGDQYECGECGAYLVALTGADGTMRLEYEEGECGAYLVALTGADGTMRLECEEDVDDALLDDQSPLCDTSVHFREDDGSDVIPW